MADVLALLRDCDPAAAAPAVADPSGIRARVTQEPRSARPRRRLPGRRLTIGIAVAALLIGGTALAGGLQSAFEVFSSPDAAGQGSLLTPVHPIAGSARAVETIDVPGVGAVQLWTADGTPPSGTCIGLQLPDGSWAGTADGNGRSEGNGPSCFTERDDPMFRTSLVATGIDWFETDFTAPAFHRVVYGVIDSDVPPTAVRMVDLVTGASTPVIDGRWFAYVDPRSLSELGRDDRQLVAYDAAGKIVTGERPAGDPNETPLRSS